MQVPFVEIVRSREFVEAEMYETTETKIRNLVSFGLGAHACPKVARKEGEETSEQRGPTYTAVPVTTTGDLHSLCHGAGDTVGGRRRRRDASHGH